MPFVDRTGPAATDTQQQPLLSTTEVPHLPQEIFERARDLSRKVLEQHALVAELARQRREAIAELIAAGLSHRQIADGVGSRVSQLAHHFRS